MSLATLLDEMVAVLRSSDIPYMLTGSIAAAVHGAGRATMDIDLVIDPTPAALSVFVQHMLDAGRYISPEAAAEALATRTMFNVVDLESGWKVDLIIRKDRPFSVAEFSRRTELILSGLRIPVATVEDLVLAKLEWAQLGGSARQLDDVRALIEIAGPSFDSRYVQEWIAALGLEPTWHRIFAS